MITSITYLGSADVFINYSNNILHINSNDPIKCKIVKNNLLVESFNSVDCFCFCFWQPRENNADEYNTKWHFDVKIKLNFITLHGSGSLQTSLSNINFSENVYVVTAGSGDLIIRDVNLTHVVATVNGSGNIAFQNCNSKHFVANISGSGNIFTAHSAEKCDCEITGSGNITCCSSEKTIINKHVLGSGKILIATF